MSNIASHTNYKYLDNLCWEGFAKVMDFAALHYPSGGKNASLALLLDNTLSLTPKELGDFIRDISTN